MAAGCCRHPPCDDLMCSRTEASACWRIALSIHPRHAYRALDLRRDFPGHVIVARPAGWRRGAAVLMVALFALLRQRRHGDHRFRGHVLVRPARPSRSSARSRGWTGLAGQPAAAGAVAPGSVPARTSASLTARLPIMPAGIQRRGSPADASVLVPSSSCPRLLHPARRVPLLDHRSPATGKSRFLDQPARRRDPRPASGRQPGSPSTSACCSPPPGRRRAPTT